MTGLRQTRPKQKRRLVGKLGVSTMLESFRLWLTPVRALGTCLMLVYLLRNSFPAALIPGWMSTLGVVSYLLLGASAVVGALSGMRIGLPCLVIFLAVLPGSLNSVDTETTIPKYLGWVLLVLAVGPVFFGRNARQLRTGAWATMIMASAAIGVGSFVWYAFRGPILGIGTFTGVMNHANTVGPLAGLGVVVGCSKALANVGRRRTYWWTVSALSIVPCVASGCRIALIAVAVGLIAVLMVEWRKVARHLVWTLLAAVLLGTGGFTMLMRSDSMAKMTSGLRDKGDLNSRELVWQARWNEFVGHRNWGVGVGYGEGGELDGVMRDDEGKLNIEPGSAYLAVLSMSGLAGAAAMGLVLGWVGWLWIARYLVLPTFESSLLIGVGAFLMTHGIAEGWIYAVGAWACLIFWLWLGRMVDVANTAKPRSPKNRRGPKKRTQGIGIPHLDAVSAEGRKPAYIRR